MDAAVVERVVLRVLVRLEGDVTRELLRHVRRERRRRRQRERRVDKAPMLGGLAKKLCVGLIVWNEGDVTTFATMFDARRLRGLPGRVLVR